MNEVGTTEISKPVPTWKEAKKRFTMADVMEQLEGIECRKDEGIIDELPKCYKELGDVMEAQSELVEIIHTLKQVVCVKG